MVFDDGEQGVDFVDSMDRDSTLARPHLFLLDLNLPKKTGGRNTRESPAESYLRANSGGHSDLIGLQ